MSIVYMVIGSIYFAATAWEVYLADKEKKSKRRAFWMICCGLWLSTIAIYLEGNQGARDMLTPLNALIVLLGVLFRDVLYENSKTSEKVKSL